MSKEINPYILRSGDFFVAMGKILNFDISSVRSITITAEAGSAVQITIEQIGDQRLLDAIRELGEHKPDAP